MVLSRRKLITAGATAGAVTLIAPVLIRTAAGQTGSDQTGSVTDYIAITRPSDPNFASRLSDLFPGLLNDPIFKKIQSHTVLITNVSNNKISACSTHWKISTVTNGYEAILHHYFHPSADLRKSAHYGVRGNKARFTGKVPLLKPGESRLVTPYLNWSPNCYKKNPNPDWKSILVQNAPRQFFLYEQSNATSIQVNVDAIVVNESTLIGSGTAVDHLGMTLRVTRNAEHDVAVGVRRYIKKGASMDQVMAYLQKQISETLPPRTPLPHYIYSAARQREAIVLLRRLNGVGPKQFLRTIRYLKKRPKTTIGLVAPQKG